MNNKKQLIYYSLLFVLVVGIIIMLIVAKLHPISLKNRDAEEYVYDEESKILSMNHGVTVSFGDVLVQELNQKRTLEVYEAQGITIPVTIKDEGIFGWEWFSKDQLLYYSATGIYTVDLDMVMNKNIEVDDVKKEIVVKIPHAVLGPIDIDFAKFTTSEVNGGFFAWGDIKMTPMEYNQIEIYMKQNIMDELNKGGYFEKADQEALNAVKSICEPIVLGLDNTYKVKVEFAEQR